MAISLPTAGAGRGGRRRTGRSTTAADVPTVNVAADTGVTIPNLAQLDPIADVGAAISDVGQVATVAAQEIRAAETAAEEEIRAAELRIQTRLEAVARARGVIEFNEYAQGAMRDFEVEGDPADPDQVAAFGQALKAKQEEIFDAHAGTEESSLQLLVSLENARAEVAGNVAEISITAGQAAVQSVVDNNQARLAASVGENPSSVYDAIDIHNGVIDGLAAALTPEQEVNSRLAGRSVFFDAAVSSFLSRGEIAGAETALEAPGAAEALGPDKVRAYRAQIIVARNRAEDGRRKAEQKLLEIATIVGVEVSSLTDEQRLRIANLGPQPGRQTLSEKVAEFAVVMNRQPTEAEIAKMANAVTEESSFGAGVRGQSLDTINELIGGYIGDTLDDNDLRRFYTATTALTQPTSYVNPDTGWVETRQSRLPGFVQEALDANRVDTTGADISGADTGATPVGDGEIPEGMPLLELEIDPTRTAWALAGTIAGPVSAIQAGVSRIPFLGEIFNFPDVTAARQVVTLMSRSYIKVLQNNPKFADAERKAIEAETNIAPELFDTEVAYQARLSGIDEFLETEAASAWAISQSKLTTSEERKFAIQKSNAATLFRAKLGVPIRVKTVEQANKLPPGTTFIGPDGITRRTPGAANSDESP
jgi:hypothetical protein